MPKHRTARQTLTLAAVASRRFDLLQHLTQQAEAQLLPLIKEAIAAQLVIEESAERFAFRHALIRQAIYSDLLTRERKVLHRAVAEAMETVYADSLDAHLPDLAYHFYEASAWDKAFDYAQHAGEKAQALNAPRAVIQQLTRTIEAAHQLSTAPASRLFRARGQAYETLGDFQAALEDYTQALNAACEGHEAMAEWQGLIDLGFLWAGRDYRQAGDYFQHALELARAMNNPLILGHSLNRAGNWLANASRLEESLRAHREALEIFRAQGHQAGMAETLDLLGIANALAGDAISAMRWSEQALELFRALNDYRSLASSLAARSMYGGAGYIVDVGLSALSTRESCERDSTEALHLARHPRSRGSPIRWPTLVACWLPG